MLTQMTVALERGNWRYVRSSLAQSIDLGGELRVVALASVFRDVAAAMRHRTIGNVQAADRRLAAALAVLSQMYRDSCYRGRAVIPVEPGREMESGLAHLLWRTARVIWREQTELAWLKERYGTIQPRDMLILACVEQLTWVLFDPLTWTTDEPHRQMALERDQYDRLIHINRGEMCARATNLRQFATPDAPDVSDNVWKNIVRHGPLMASAMQELAGQPLAIWGAGPHDPERDVPVRRPRLHAWKAAQQWHHDLGSTYQG